MASIPREHKPEGPFRFFDLPNELRLQILHLLLPQGNIALTCRIKRRYPHWNHERPAWELLTVNRQMRAEASAILYSAKNTFFLPIGPIDATANFLLIRGPYLSPVKRLDCAFDMRDVVEDDLATLQEARGQYNSQDSERFEELSGREKLIWIHDTKRQLLISAWSDTIASFVALDLDLLRIDLTNPRCPIGCCRLGCYVLELIHAQAVNIRTCFKRIETLGVSPQEREKFKKVVEESSYKPEDGVFFVDTEGCTCKAHEKPKGI